MNITLCLWTTVCHFFTGNTLTSYFLKRKVNAQIITINILCLCLHNLWISNLICISDLNLMLELDYKYGTDCLPLWDMIDDEVTGQPRMPTCVHTAMLQNTNSDYNTITCFFNVAHSAYWQMECVMWDYREPLEQLWQDTIPHAATSSYHHAGWVRIT